MEKKNMTYNQRAKEIQDIQDLLLDVAFWKNKAMGYHDQLAKDRELSPTTVTELMQEIKPYLANTDERTLLIVSDMLWTHCEAIVRSHKVALELACDVIKSGEDMLYNER